MTTVLIPRRLRSFAHVSEHNWLVHETMIRFLREVAPKYASGDLLDIGCGLKPYQSIFAPFVSKHIGVDLETSPHGTDRIDLIGSAYATNVAGESCDVVLCSEVLEHLEEPLAAVKEMNRVLNPGGVAIVTVPFFWHIHEEPRDFYRYTEYGLRYLFEQGGFEILEVRPLSGFVVAFTQLTIYYLKRFQRLWILRAPGRLFDWALQRLALLVNRFDRSPNFTIAYGLVARKRDQASVTRPGEGASRR